MQDRERQTARRGLVLYFAFLVVGSAFFEWKILQTGQPIDQLPLLITALMYVPAVSSVAARLILREGFGDVSFRMRGRDTGWSLRLAWGYPIAVGLVSYGIAWATGLAHFQQPLSPRSHLYVDAAMPNLLASLLLTSSLGAAVACLATFGEEVGWRGYMLTRLITAQVPRPVFVSGVIWALWHVPLILSGQYTAGTNRWLASGLFVIGVLADAYLVAYLRLRSGSIWPSVFMHGAWNAIIQGTFDGATAGASSAVGESGWLTVTAALAFVAIVTRGVWTFERRPGEPLKLANDRAEGARDL